MTEKWVKTHQVEVGQTVGPSGVGAMFEDFQEEEDSCMVGQLCPDGWVRPEWEVGLMGMAVQCKAVLDLVDPEEAGTHSIQDLNIWWVYFKIVV